MVAKARLRKGGNRTQARGKRLAADHSEDHGQRARGVSFDPALGYHAELTEEANQLHALLNDALTTNAHNDVGGLCAAVCATTATLAGLICAAVEMLGDDAPQMLRLAGVTLGGPVEIQRGVPYLVRLTALIDRQARERMH